MAERLSAEAIQKHLKKVPQWRRDRASLVREYEFSSFVAAMVFVNFVADTAESMDHHPDIHIHYKRVKLVVSTHSAQGLTELDFRLAKAIDA